MWNEKESAADSTLSTIPLRLAALTALAMCFTTSAITWFWRVQVGNDSASLILILVALTGGLIFLPLWSQCSSLPNIARAPLTIILPVALLGYVCLAGQSSIAAAGTPIVLFACWVAGGRQLIALSSVRRQMALAVALGMALGFASFFVVNQVGTANVFSPEALLVGQAHLDTLFHASVASMVARHGIVSTGLDGLVPFGYHGLSHLVVGSISLWMKSSSVQVYADIMLVTGVPVLLFSLTVAIFSFWQPSGTVFAPLNIVLVPLAGFSIIEIWDTWYSYLASESYLIALILFLFSFPIIVVISQGSAKAAFWSATVALSMVPIIVFAKSSVGFVFGCTTLAAVLIRTLPRKLFWIMSATAIALAVVFVTALLVASPHVFQVSQTLSFAAFPFFETYPRTANACLVAGLVGLGCIALTDTETTALRTSIAIAILVAIYPALIADLPGGAQYYFIHIAVFVAIVSVSAFAILPQLAKASTIFPTVAIVILILVSIYSSPSKRTAIAGFLQKTERLVNSTRSGSDKTKLGSFAEAAASLRTFAEEARATPISQTLDAFRTAAGTDQRRIAAYISPSSFHTIAVKAPCKTWGFLLPASVGIPMLLGVPNDCELEYYGFANYGLQSRNRNVGDSELCSIARRAEFSRVLRNDGDTTVRQLDCE